MPDFTKREGNHKILVVNTVHGDIKPVPTKGRLIVIDFPGDFPSGGSGMADVGTKPCTSFSRM